jgi:VanZ family protein
MKTTASRLSAALLGYITLIILLLTLNPFYLSLPEQVDISFYTTRGDMIANLLLFLPIGFLYRLTGGTRRGAIIAGAAISFGIEAVQIMIPARTSSAMDFLGNTLGAGVGATIHDLIASHVVITAGTVGRLRLETPLMGLNYLLIPLLWVNGLVLRTSHNRWVLTVLIGICGAIVFGELFRHWSEVVRFRQAVNAALATGVWFLAGLGLGVVRSLPALAIGLGMMLLAAVLTVVPRRSVDRRFERPTLKRLFPFFTLYVLLMALWYPLRPLTAWHGMFGFTTRLADTSLQGLYPRLEYLIVFTVLGYLVAEWRGRDELPLKRDLPRLLAIAAGSAILLELLVGFQAGLGASFVRGTMAVISALFGGTIYHLLRAHILFLLKR